MTISAYKARIAATVTLALFVSSALALKDPQKEQKPFGLIFGTVYGPDDRPVYGVRVRIHPVGRKRPNWELVSDHQGEFAQRVPIDPADYEVIAEAEITPIVDGKPQRSLKKRVKDVRKVHVDQNVEQDISLHLRNQEP